MHFVYAMYDHERSAERAVKGLLQNRVSYRDINVLLRDGNTVERAPLIYGTRMTSNAVTGGALGVLLGGVLATTGALDMLASGSVLAALQGAAVGGIAGTLAGAVRGLGWWKTDAEFPEDFADRGDIMVGVNTSEHRLAEVQDLLEDAGGHTLGVTQQPTKTARKHLGIQPAHSPATGA